MIADRTRPRPRCAPTGASHHHSFVGNTGTSASSTLESLLADRHDV
jgi:hypothetical protein